MSACVYGIIPSKWNMRFAFSFCLWVIREFMSRSVFPFFAYVTLFHSLNRFSKCATIFFDIRRECFHYTWKKWWEFSLKHQFILRVMNTKWKWKKWTAEWERTALINGHTKRWSNHRIHELDRQIKLTKTVIKSIIFLSICSL